MRVALIADTFPPLRNSGAVQLRDLVREFARQGHSVFVLLPAPGQLEPWRLEEFGGARVIRLRAQKSKDVSYLRRTFAELTMPFYMLRNFRKTPFFGACFDGVVWYSPSIFHGPLVQSLRRSNGCSSYLIIRDIFPEWAADMGLMSGGMVFRFFKAIANYQYSVADVIGVQTLGNLKYFKDWHRRSGRKVEVLQNWLGKAADMQCSINITDTNLAGRKVFVYAGNMGVAQGMDIIVDLAERLRDRNDIGFLFVGRGGEFSRLTALVDRRGLDNVIFSDEINPDEIPGLYAQCSIGIVCLDPRHKSHNIPGKFLTYMQSGVPVLANINAGNDLAQIIRDKRVGEVCESNQLDDLLRLAEHLLDQLEHDPAMPIRCRELFQREFSVEGKVKQIVDGLSKRTNRILASL
jgi:glycosyltransferase involved in cell wall biosynthesis